MLYLLLPNTEFISIRELGHNFSISLVAILKTALTAFEYTDRKHTTSCGYVTATFASFTHLMG
jgi:hypothetical protein